MYEGCEDLQELFGGDFIRACQSLEIFDALETERRTVLKRLSVFRHQHLKKWKVVRLNAAAHRDHDALAVLHAIANLSAGDTVAEARELDDILRSLGAFSMNAISAANVVCVARGIIPDVGTEK